MGNIWCRSAEPGGSEKKRRHQNVTDLDYVLKWTECRRYAKSLFNSIALIVQLALLNILTMR